MSVLLLPRIATKIVGVLSDKFLERLMYFNMYLKDLDVRITLRLSQEQMDFLIEMSELYNVSPSAFLRMMIDKYMIMGEDSHEDEQTILDNKL